METNLKSLKKETAVFIVLVFGLTFLLNFVMLINFDLFVENQELLVVALRFEMLIPAFSAITLNLFVFKTKAYPRKSRILYYYFLVITALSALLFALRLGIRTELGTIPLDPMENLGLTVLMGVLIFGTNLLALGWIALIFVWNLKAGWRKELEDAKLSFGKPSYYLLFSLFFFGYFLLSTILNCGFGLGSPPSEQADKRLSASSVGFFL